MRTSTWRPPSRICVEGAWYDVRMDARGFLEVRIDGVWVGQSFFQTYDEPSARMVTEFMVAWVRHRVANHEPIPSPGAGLN